MGAIVTLYCNMVSCPHNNGDSAGGCCTIPAGMLVNANGECDQAVIVKRARKIPCCGTQPTIANTGSPKLLNRLQAVLPMVKNGMNSVQIHAVRGVIADAIEQLQANPPQAGA